MAAPSEIALRSGNFHAGSGLAATAHGIGARADVLQLFCIFHQNDSTSNVASVVSCASDNGLTWTKLTQAQNTALASVSPGPVHNTVQTMEVWWAFGPITNGGTFSFSLDRTVDGCTWLWSSWSGANTALPFDLNPSLPQSVTNTTSSDIVTTSTTDTSDVILVAAFGRAANSFAGNPRFNSSGTDLDGNAAAEFTSTNNMRSYARFLSSTSGFVGQKAGYSAAFGNGPVTNYVGVAFAITADAQSLTPSNGRVSGVGVEVLSTVATPKPRVSGVGVEVLSTVAELPRVSGLGVEVLSAVAAKNYRVAALGVEVLSLRGTVRRPPVQASAIVQA